MKKNELLVSLKFPTFLSQPFSHLIHVLHVWAPDPVATHKGDINGIEFALSTE